MKEIQGTLCYLCFTVAFVRGPDGGPYCAMNHRNTIQGLDEINYSHITVRTPFHSGNVTYSLWNSRILSIALGLGIVASIKRLWLGLWFGKKTYGKWLAAWIGHNEKNYELNSSPRVASLVANHARDLAKVINKALMLCEVAALGRELELQSSGEDAMLRAPSISRFGLSKEEFDGIVRRNMENDDDSGSRGGINGLDHSSYKGGLIVDPADSDPRKCVLDQSQRIRIDELLGAWEEPALLVGAEVSRS